MMFQINNLQLLFNRKFIENIKVIFLKHLFLRYDFLWNERNITKSKYIDELEL